MVENHCLKLRTYTNYPPVCLKANSYTIRNAGTTKIELSTEIVEEVIINAT